ncbi:MAG: copper uptake system-associated protein [Bradyrhizobium sp.]
MYRCLPSPCIADAFAATIRAVMISLALLLVSASASAASDEDAIRKLLMTSFDRPDSRLAVDPVIVAGDHGIADWTQGKLGGRALVRRKAGQWMIVLCSGDGIKSEHAMRLAGVPASDAAILADNLALAEKSMPAERLGLLATFEGTVMMGADGGHPPAAQGQSHSEIHLQRPQSNTGR